MKKYIYYTFLWVCALTSACAQGVFLGANSTAPTRLGSVDGPLAGTNIIGQMLGGPGASSLQPVGPIEYHNNGIFSASYITVPDVPPREYAYVQLVAWDSTFWGNSLSGVPPDQLGRTDVVTVFLTTGVFPDVFFVPQFTQAAIVPPIPEPSVLRLGVMGCALMVFLRRRAKGRSRVLAF